MLPIIGVSVVSLLVVVLLVAVALLSNQSTSKKTEYSEQTQIQDNNKTVETKNYDYFGKSINILIHQSRLQS